MGALGWGDGEVGWGWGVVSWEQAVGELGEGVELGNSSTSSPCLIPNFQFRTG